MPVLLEFTFIYKVFIWNDEMLTTLISKLQKNAECCRGF